LMPRRGLSEILGALILVIIMMGIISTIYIAGNNIENRIKTAGREASYSIMLARNPPRLRLTTANGTVYAIISGSGVPVRLESMIISTLDNRENYISINKILRPGEELRIPLYPAPCKPTRIALVTQSGGYLFYPENGTWFCQSDEREKIIMPNSGEELDPVPLPVMLTPIGTDTPNYTLKLNLKIIGSMTRSGPPTGEAIKVFVNNSLAGQISRQDHEPVNLTRIGPGTLQLQAYNANGTLFMLVLSYVSSAERWIITARANATMDLHVNTRTTDVCGPATWTLPVIYGAISHSLRVEGSCTMKTPIEGSFNMSGVSMSSESFILLVSTNSRPASIVANYSIELRIYKANNQCAHAHVSIPPGDVVIGFERPHIKIVPLSILSEINKYFHIIVDPFKALIAVSGPNDPTLGHYMVDAAQTLVLANTGRPLQADVCVSQPLPASNASIFLVSVKKTSSYKVLIRASIEDGRVAQPWAFPGILRFRGNSWGKAFIVYQTPLVLETGPLATVFPLEELRGNASTAYAKRLSSEDFTYVTWPSARGGSVVEPLVLPASGRDLEAIAGAPGVVLVYWRAGSLETPLGSLDAYVGIIVWVN